MLKALRPLSLCLLCRVPVESMQIGVTVSGQHLTLFLCGRGVIYSLEGGQILRRDLKLSSLRAGHGRCLFYVPDSIMFPI